MPHLVAPDRADLARHLESHASVRSTTHRRAPDDRLVARGGQHSHSPMRRMCSLQPCPAAAPRAWKDCHGTLCPDTGVGVPPRWAVVVRPQWRPGSPPTAIRILASCTFAPGNSSTNASRGRAGLLAIHKPRLRLVPGLVKRIGPVGWGPNQVSRPKTCSLRDLWLAVCAPITRHSQSPAARRHPAQDGGAGALRWGHNSRCGHQGSPHCRPPAGKWMSASLSPSASRLT